MLRVPRLGVAFALLVAALLACSSNGDKTDDNNFRKDVIECEDALDKLTKCCPNFDATPVQCNFYYHYTSGCGSSTTESVKPALSEGESKCVRDRGCDQLRSEGVCDRAQAARAYTFREQVDDTSSLSSGSSGVVNNTHDPVCQ